jgi:peptidoglycan/xylan/chitin deacetylase (PgdA/CDA1 family)
MRDGDQLAEDSQESGLCDPLKALPRSGTKSAARSPGLRTVVIFWDYDTQWGADRSRSPGGPKQWGMLDFLETERLLDIHAEYDIPACFAVVGSACLPGSRPYHDPAQIALIHKAGHEVASHSHRHEWLPGLAPEELRETLVSSKSAIEQCIQAPVTTFVPPYNQPFDCPARFSFSLSERRLVRRDRVDLFRLCSALRDAGYGLCRVAYRSLPERILERFTGSRRYSDSRLERMAGLPCLRINTVGGFKGAEQLLKRPARRNGVLVVYGHPHSLRSGNSQDESWLRPFLAAVRALRDAGQIATALPRDLLPQRLAKGTTRCDLQ